MRGTISEVASQQSFASRVNEFTFDLYKRLGEKPGNVFASPKNVLDCLAMVYSGSHGATARAMQKACLFPDSSDETAREIGLVNKALAQQKDCTIRTANGIWAQQGFPFAPSYVQTLREAFGAEFRTVNYMDVSTHEAIVKDANGWVEDQTRGLDGEGKIKDLLSTDDLTVDTVLTLISAIYFYGEWEHQFQEQATATEPFHLDDGQTSCRLMRRQGTYRYAETPELQVIDLPYKGDQLRMTVLLPRHPNGLRAVETVLSGTGFDQLLQKMAEEDVRLFLPRWKGTAEYDLGDTLQEMGMDSAFHGGADFGGMVGDGAADQGAGLAISKVIHKAFVDVTEKGTEAAAATAVVIRLSAMLPEPEPKVFRADHPFTYVIRHVPTGTVLFVGRLSNPAAA